MKTRRLLTSLRREYKSIFRNRMVIFGLFGPLLMVLIFQLILPAAASFELVLAVPDDLPAAARSELSRLAKLIEVDDRDELEDVVARQSDTPGVVLRDGELTLLLQGDEDEGALEAAGRAVATAQAALEGSPLPGSSIEVVVDEDNALTRWRNVFAQCFALFGGVIGALAVGFSLMEERISGVSAALAVSPLSRSEYLVGKSLAAGLLSFVLPPLIYLLMGLSVNWGALLTVSAVGVATGSGLGLLLGLYANSEMQMMTYFKAMAIIIFPPVVAALIPPAWEATMWWLPTYWLARGFGSATDGNWPSLVLEVSIALVMGLGLIAFAVGRLRHRLKAA